MRTRVRCQRQTTRLLSSLAITPRHYFLDRRPIKDIQALCGHANQSTTEIYIKQRWQETAQPNEVVIA